MLCITETKSPTPMRDLEKYYGVSFSRKQSVMQMLKRSSRSKAKQTAERLLREVNGLYVKGLYSQCLGLLEKAVQLVPNDPRSFYLLGLIHEERGNFEKAQTSFYICALLRRGDTAMWRKVLSMSTATDDCKSQAIALGKIYRREPSEALLLKRIECFRKLRKKYWMVACEIELFDYRAVDNSVFDRFKNTYHVNTLRIICHRLLECIQKNEAARSEYFIRNTVFNLYKIKSWAKILGLLDDFYFGNVDEVVPEIRAIYYMAYISCSRASEMQEGAAENAEESPSSSSGCGSETSEGAGYAAPFAGATGDLIKWGLEEDYDSGSVEADGRTRAERSTVSPSPEAPMHLDGGLLLEGFVLDKCEWNSIRDGRYFVDLADFLRDTGLVGYGIEVLERMYAQRPCTRLRIKIADFIHLSGDAEAAAACYNEVLAADPTNMQVKARLHKLYTELGESSLAREYETSVRAFRHSRGLDGRSKSKKKYRYSSDKCRHMRTAYERANAVLTKSASDYLECTRGLLADFFANPFITVKYKNFKSFLVKHEPVVKESGIVLYDDAVSKRKLSEEMIRISSLHGLDVDEWYSVVQNSLVQMIGTDDCGGALRLARSALPVHLFRESRYLFPLAFLGTKSALRVGDAALTRSLIVLYRDVLARISRIPQVAALELVQLYACLLVEAHPERILGADDNGLGLQHGEVLLVGVGEVDEDLSVAQLLDPLDDADAPNVGAAVDICYLASLKLDKVNNLVGLDVHLDRVRDADCRIHKLEVEAVQGARVRHAIGVRLGPHLGEAELRLVGGYLVYLELAAGVEHEAVVLVCLLDGDHVEEADGRLGVGHLLPVDGDHLVGEDVGDLLAGLA